MAVCKNWRCGMTDFIDAQAQAEKSPDTFSVYHLEDLRAFVGRGDFVKVCHSEERFWVKVTKVEKDVVTGLVSNDLIRAEFDCGQQIKFELRHVFDYIAKEQETETVDSEEENLRGVHSFCN